MKLDYKRPTVSFGFNNRTTRLVEDGRFTAVGKAYRLLRDGDMTTLRLGASVDFKDSLQAGLSHSTPVGRNGVRAEARATVLRSRPAGTDIEGDAELYSAALTAPLIRSFKRNMLLRASFDAVNSDNAAFGSLIATEETRALRLSLAFSDRPGRFSYRVKLEGAQGIDVAGANVTEQIGDENYFKLKGDVSLARRFGDDFYLRLKSAGQWTGDALPANERFSLGGPRFGRAFKNSLINADRGYAFLLEPAWRPIGGGDFSKSEIYAFADYAQADVFSRLSGANRTYDIGSYGAGLRAAFKDKGVLELEASHPYDQPVPGYGQDWRFSIGWRLDWRP
jgi:hemolysin activation/secretion protein